MKRASHHIRREEQNRHRAAELGSQRPTDHVVRAAGSHLAVRTQRAQGHGCEERHRLTDDEHASGEDRRRIRTKASPPNPLRRQPR